MLASVIIMGIGFVPGMPLMPFMALSSMIFAASYAVNKAKKEEIVPVERTSRQKTHRRKKTVQPLEILELEIGYALIPIVDAEQGGELLDKIRAIRKQVAMDLGIVVPPMKLKDNLQLKAGEYVIQLKGIEVGRGDLTLGPRSRHEPRRNRKAVEGTPTKEPVFNLEAYWVKEADREKYVAEGLTIVDHPTIIATHLTEIVRNNAHELLTRRETQKLIDSIASVHQKVIEEITQNQINMGSVQKVLQNLLREQVSIRDLVTILEAIADCSSSIKDPDVITEYVRQRMARSILKPYLVDGILNILLFREVPRGKSDRKPPDLGPGQFPCPGPPTSQRLIERIGEEAKR